MKRMKGNIAALLAIAAAVFAAKSGTTFFDNAGALKSGAVPYHTTDYGTESDTLTGYGDGYDLEVHYIDVGQGDATLITCGDHAVLVDAGNNSMGTKVQAYLQEQDIEFLDYVIGTHPDADHIGGLDVILYKFDCDRILMPDLAHNTATYRDVVQVIKEKDLAVTVPKRGSVYTFGDALFTVIAPAAYYYGLNNNDYSIGILLEYGDTVFLFTGDAEEAAEADMLDSGLDLQADVYKVAHHGSKTSSTQAFLEAVQPKYAVISCGEDNPYGHPHASTLNTLRQMGIQVFRTDEQGTIVARSNGTDIVWNTSPSESWQAGEYHPDK